MLDFLMISTRVNKKGIEIYPKFIVRKSKDLMIRGNDFYAIWDEESGLWSTSEDTAIFLIDRELDIYAKEHSPDLQDTVKVLHLWDSDTGMIDKWHKFVKQQMSNNFHNLNETVIFSNTPVDKTNYASIRAPYALEKGSYEAFSALLEPLYEPDELHKIEWVIGSIVDGASKNLQKFLVLYGSAGTGKSTVINIIQSLFPGYFAAFDAESLGMANSPFALEAFKNNPLIGIQHDADLSHIEKNTRLNSLVSHEVMTVNEKFKSQYEMHFNSFLIMGTNSPVKITGAKSGIIRRLIDVSPTGKKHPFKKYQKLVNDIQFELGAIAYHCREVFQEDPQAYDNYVSTKMIEETNDFYNFVLYYVDVFSAEDTTTAQAAWKMYNKYNELASVKFPLSYRPFKAELKSYFKEYDDRGYSKDGIRVRGVYSGFLKEKFEYGASSETIDIPEVPERGWLEFKDATTSILDDFCSACSAQYATDDDTKRPLKKWADARTSLSDLDPTKMHYVRVPENLIVIDFDIQDENGEKSYAKNLEAASQWPATYAELSKSGSGIHLHYLYSGDPTRLSRVYSEHVEIKVFTGNSSLRRKLTKCNDIPIATFTGCLPLREERKVVNFEAVKNEKALRTLVLKNLRKEYHPGTKPSCDFIYKILQDAYEQGVHYDITDLRPAVFEFAYHSTHQAEYCAKLVNKMHFKSDDPSSPMESRKDALIFFDVEVMPNLFVIDWKIAGGTVVKMINPSPGEVAALFEYKLVGFNNRKYDNHIIYARSLGYSNEQLYKLSQDIIVRRTGFFGEAYNISYTDIYDFAATKMSLKKWEIQLGIHHQELGLPWDQPVPEELWGKVADYCANDVEATEAVWNHLQADFTAREILADISGLTVNDTTRMHTTKIIFGNEKHPELVYTNLEEEFPGYSFENGHNMYRGTDLGFGGYVYAEPGMYTNVALLDVASLHPHSIIAMNCFGEYTKNFKDLMDARIYIKHKDFDSAKKLMGGALAPYLKDESQAKALSKALKIVINSVYGYTSASFDNPFRDIRNKNNIVALRGALFMRTLQDEVVARGFTVAHIKTDSIKIPNATPEIIDYCMKFAEKYGYSFEHEATYEKMCLVNNAVYIAKGLEGEHAGEWTATGTQFQIPYVFKTLFSKEKIEFADLCETKEVQTALYLDFDENLKEGEHNYQYIGKVGLFCPIKEGYDAGVLYREKDGKYYAATGTKGYRWLEAETVKTLHKEDEIDMRYFNSLCDAAVNEIKKYGDFEWFAG